MKIDRVPLHGMRRVYVSWQLKDPARKAWKDEFWDRLDVDTQQLPKAFGASLQSNDADPGTLAPERIGALFAKGAGKSPVTDIVAVLSNDYVGANTARGEAEAAGELARFLAHLDRNDPDGAVCVYVAPVDKPRWDIWKVRDVLLGSLVRLRERRFTWPIENLAACADEVADAVELITGDAPQGG